jgi:hypothetical protein
MWEPQPLATLRASTACTGLTLPLPYLRPAAAITELFCRREPSDFGRMLMEFQIRMCNERKDRNEAEII